MFALSSKSSYGVAAIFELALTYGNNSCVQVSQIAKAQGIPEGYLRQLLIILKRSGLVESVRGAQGGYALARPPAAITVREIIECLDGSLNLVEAIPDDKVLASYWRGRQQKIERIFDQTIEDLVIEKQKQKQSIVYQI